jgi:hypothetical protein
MNAYLFVFWRAGEKLGLVVEATSKEAAAKAFADSAVVKGYDVRIENVRKLQSVVLPHHRVAMR